MDYNRILLKGNVTDDPKVNAPPTGLPPLRSPSR